MNFPSAVAAPSSSTSRPSYHARLLSPSLPPTDAGTLRTDFGPRPALISRNSSSYRHSLVKVSSPLRQEVDEAAPASRPPVRKSNSFMSIGGLLSPPSSPEDTIKPPPAQWSTVGSAAGERGRAFRPRSMMEGTAFAAPSAFRPPTPPTSPPTSPVKRPPPKRTASGLWADAIPATPSNLSPAKGDPKTTTPPDVDFSANAMAPKFSRSGIKKSGIVMPVSAPRSSSSSSLSSLRGKSSRSSLRLNSPSSTSLSSMTSSRGSTIRRQSKSPFASQDRLSSLAETSQKELQLNEEGLLALDSLSPPRPAFMRQRSNSSLSSLSSLTSAASSAQASSLDSCDPIAELDERAVRRISVGRREEVGAGAHGMEELDTVDELGALVISCTKSDADADGSVESSSMKSGSGGTSSREMKKKGGLFKRLTKALKLEKKNVTGNDGGRRGSV